MKNNNSINTAKSVFINLLEIIAFYASAVSFVIILFQYVNVLFPDELHFLYQEVLSQIRVSMSILIVSFPVYLAMSFIINKELFKNLMARDFKLRKWLIYFTLFITAIVMIGDLITVIFKFLDGELSIRFYLKVLIIFIVSGGIFWYYLWNLKRKIQNKSNIINKSLVFISSAIILASIISGFFIVGSPAHQRSIKFDAQRINDLQITQSRIIDYWINKNNLPENLNALTDNIGGFNPLSDPKTKNFYEYNILSNISFELCALFETSSYNYKGISQFKSPYATENWEHNKGKTCFKRDIDPDIYNNRFPVLEKAIIR